MIQMEFLILNSLPWKTAGARSQFDSAALWIS